MYETREIDGFQVNLRTSKRGDVRSAVVLVGPADKPGWRAKDGQAARLKRREAKRAVMAALDLPAKAVTVCARYSCLSVQSDGMVARRDDAGNIIGYHEV